MPAPKKSPLTNLIKKGAKKAIRLRQTGGAGRIRKNTNAVGNVNQQAAFKEAPRSNIKMKGAKERGIPNNPLPNGRSGGTSNPNPKAKTIAGGVRLSKNDTFKAANARGLKAANKKKK